MNNYVFLIKFDGFCEKYALQLLFCRKLLASLHCYNIIFFFHISFELELKTSILKTWHKHIYIYIYFRLLDLDSLKYSSKAESPINRPAKAVISRNLTTSRHNHLFIYLFIYLFLFYIFYFLFFFSIYLQKTGITVLSA